MDTWWLDTNKAAPGLPPDVRSRSAAREIAVGIRGDLFARPPALEAIKILISMMASSAEGGGAKETTDGHGHQTCLLHATMTREVHIRLTAEAPEGDGEEMVGVLLKALYGTREAPQHWQARVVKVLKQFGFTLGKANPVSSSIVAGIWSSPYM